jgi:hypothetical protein
MPRAETMNIATTALEAFERYTEYLHDGRLVQDKWHDTASDGRALACGLGVLGDDVSSPEDCPAAIMPRWLAQMVPWFFDNQSFEDAAAWGAQFYAELARLGGNVPFSVVFDWQHSVVGPLAIEWAKAKKGNVSAHTALAKMHFAALTGKKMTADEWRPVLKAAFFDIYKYIYRADANAYADAFSDADADAYVKYREPIHRLAMGMVECLKRVPA